MKIFTEKGVLNHSEIHFSSPTPTAQRLYYCPISSGHFYCTNSYHVKRSNMNSVLLLYVETGTLIVKTPEKEFSIGTGQSGIVNCFHPHEYYTNEGLEFYWAHINGLNIEDLYKEAVDTVGNVIDSADTRKNLSKLHTMLDKDQHISETKLSLFSYKALVEFLNPTPIATSKNATYAESIEKAKLHIEENISETLTVAGVAKVVHMSTSNFSKVFKRYTGFSPYDYVLAVRLNEAKRYLKQTSKTIAEIAFEVGFNSESNFIYFFTGSTGLSPTQFRKLPF